VLVRRTIAIVACLVLGVAACSDDDEGGESTTTTSERPLAPLTIMVTNDDGIGAPGIDVLVNALLELEAVEVHVVAPASDQTGKSDMKTPGGAKHTDGATASGVEGTAVEGFPADTVNVALDVLGLDPDLVVSGINKGQNVGPLAYASGTVGAGREAIRRGIPAIAGSAALDGDGYELAAQLVIDQIEDHRAEYVAGTIGTIEAVVNINVPDCTVGEPKDLLTVDLATEIPAGVDVFASDCTVEPATEPPDDVLAVAAGHPALSLVPPEAASG
jgi:5'-nucleotidase